MYEDPSIFVLAAHRRGLHCKSWGPGPLGVPARAGCIYIAGISIVASSIYIAADIFMAHGIIYS